MCGTGSLKLKICGTGMFEIDNVWFWMSEI